MNSIRGIHHISLKTADPDQFQQAIRFYCEVLGCTVYRRWNEGVLLDTGGGMIEIFCSGEGIGQKGAIRHVALEVTDTDSMAAKAASLGYPCMIPPKDLLVPSDPPLHARIAFLQGPLGEEIELFQTKDP